jgi:hypothetical protein
MQNEYGKTEETWILGAVLCPNVNKEKLTINE